MVAGHRHSPCLSGARPAQPLSTEYSRAFGATQEFFDPVQTFFDKRATVPVHAAIAKNMGFSGAMAGIPLKISNAATAYFVCLHTSF